MDILDIDALLIHRSPHRFRGPHRFPPCRQQLSLYRFSIQAAEVFPNERRSP